jgi:hypothetical protein
MPAVYTAETSLAINERHREALGIYSRAISKVRALAAQKCMDESTIALSYLLFASIEFHHRSEHPPFLPFSLSPFEMLDLWTCKLAS